MLATVEDAVIRPAPDPSVPFVVGGRSDAAVRRAALQGDGWLGVWCSPRRFADVVDEIARIEAAEGSSTRGPEDWMHGLQVWVGLDANRDVARDRLAHRMEKMYQTPFARFEKYSPYGDAETIAAFLTPYIESRCRTFNIMPVAESTEAAIEGIAEVAARLRDAC